MSSLTFADKQYLEKILDMERGYVLNFSDASFDEFFRRYSVAIHSTRYQTTGTSKARKLRAFWQLESDILVANVMSAMLDTYEANCALGYQERNADLLRRSREIVARLSGKSPKTNSTTDEGFLSQEFEVPNIQKLPVAFSVAEIIKSRLDEAQTTLREGAYLSTIFLCGSVLEGVLLGASQQHPEQFNRSNVSPKHADGKVKQFHEWRLSEFIDVACDIGILKPDVQKFSHGLRGFRNYIHPYEQLASNFTPDEHTAKVCFQVLKAALASVAGER